MLPKSGSEIGSYIVQELVDESLDSMTFRVRHKELGSEHALKLMSREDEQLRRRLLAEARTFAEIRHANLVRVTDLVREERRTGLVMDLHTGPSLDVWLGEDPSWEARAAVLTQIVDAVAHLHRSTLIHRDLQPGNVVVETTRDGMPRAVITNFSLARSERQERSTEPGSFIGTPGYMAPEQIRDPAGVDSRADVFSLGCLMYLIVCRVGPFASDVAVDALNATATGNYKPAGDVAPDAPWAILSAIQHCLRTDRARRPHNAMVLKQMLRRRPSMDREPDNPPLSSALSAVRRNPIPWLASVTGAVVVGVATWWLLS